MGNGGFMEPRPVPISIQLGNPDGREITVGRPPDVPEDECGDATMFLEATEFAGQKAFPVYSAYFQPTKYELEQLNKGGYIRVNMLGHVVPHSAQVVDA